MSTKEKAQEGALKSAGAALRGGRVAGSGRAKGTVNRATATAREAIAAFVDGNTQRLESVLDRIENGIPVRSEVSGDIIMNSDGSVKWLVEPNPKAAFDAMQSVIEYHIPKLARVEQTGKDGGPITHANLVANLDLKGLSDGELEQVMHLLGRAT
jgi:hypothetical protein